MAEGFLKEVWVETCIFQLLRDSENVSFVSQLLPSKLGHFKKINKKQFMGLMTQQLANG